MIPFKLFFERALGLVETITIKGIGPVDAKVDSGNGAYNVLHGINVKDDGKSVQFTTVGDKNIVKPLIEVIDINIGSGNIEHRPLCYFDIEVEGKSHKNIKFSIADRSSNDEKVLLGKDFIESLGRLIDVSKTHTTSVGSNAK